jgi:hypothetical protein
MLTGILSLSGPVLTLIGMALGMWGTLLMVRAYHPFSTLRVVVNLLQVLALCLTGRMKQAGQLLEDASRLAEINEENRFRTLVGIYLLVFSFLLQTLGAALIVIDTARHAQA